MGDETGTEGYTLLSPISKKNKQTKPKNAMPGMPAAAGVFLKKGEARALAPQEVMSTYMNDAQQQTEE